MTSLAFNTQTSKFLRRKYQLLLSIFPLGLMFGSFLLLWAFAVWLAAYLGMPAGAAVKHHPNGYIWLAIFSLVMLFMMFSGYILGWIINAAIIKIVFGWNVEKLRRVFLFSDVPDDWRKEISTADHSVSQSSSWGTTRKKGKWKYILVKGVFGWGGFMYLIMVVAPAVRGGLNATIYYFSLTALLWALAGAMFGATIWYFSEKQYAKQMKAGRVDK